MKRCFHVCGALFAAAFLTCAADDGAWGSNLAVHTAEGDIVGLSAADTDEFLGIPYARPPIGPLRWMPPQPITWSGVLRADRLPAPCPQLGGGFGIASVNEDCLFLDVYAPRTRTGKLPVMVWIHGGADETGTGAQFDGSALAREGVIVVTINYRLGYLGFLAHPALDAGSPGHASGDYGLMDQQAALRWVNQNAAAFGGDPGRITLFGQSAGGMAVFDHLASPSAAGLFNRAIIESGAEPVALRTLDAAEVSGKAFADAVGCSGTMDRSCLERLPVATILAQEAHTIGDTAASSTRFQPDVGPPILPEQPLATIRDGTFNHVPVLMGTNHDEARVFVAVDDNRRGSPIRAKQYPNAIAAVVGQKSVPDVEALYPLTAYKSPGLAYAQMFTDAAFSCPALGEEEMLARQVNVYAYEFADENAAGLSSPRDPFMALGAPHGSELPFIWPNLVGSGGRKGAAMTTAQLALAARMRAAWASFAETGDPKLSASETWPSFGAARQIIELAPGKQGLVVDFNAEHHCGYWLPALVARGGP